MVSGWRWSGFDQHRLLGLGLARRTLGHESQRERDGVLDAADVSHAGQPDELRHELARDGARAGQVMSVLFRPSNRSCYINVWTPGADSAAFNGSVTGNEYTANLAMSGDYAIQVYLMRNAARRNETCRYRVTVEITGAPGGASAGVSDIAMQDRCKSEAAGMYGVQPKQIATGAIRPVPGGFEIDGTADKGAEGIKKLRCIFDGRSFTRIMAMTPDGE